MRYDVLDLSQIAPPASVEELSFDTAYAAWLDDLATQAAAYGASYNVATLRSDPLGWFCRVGAYRGDVILRQRVNDGIKAVLVPTARGTDQDNLFADFNVVRKVIVPADPVTNTAAVMESDDDFRDRRLLAPEALSSAGPGGAYAFFARDAHPDVKDVGVYGPQSGHVDDGHVAIVVLSRAGDGVPTTQVLLAVAQKLHAWTAPDIDDYTPPTRSQLDADNLRPDTDWVEVRAIANLDFTVAGTMTVPPGADADTLRVEAQRRVQAYAAQQRRVGAKVTLDGLIAAARMMDANGVSPLIKFALSSPVADVVATWLQAPRLATLTDFTIVVDDG